MHLALLLVVTTEAAVTADRLMVQVVERARVTAKLRHERGLAGTKLERSYDIEDRSRDARLIEEKEFRLTMAPDGLLHQLLRINGAPVEPGSPERPEIDPTALIIGLHAKYNFRMASPEPIGGEYSVSFDPKQPVSPSGSEAEMVVNHLSGILYIDADRLYVRRFQAWLERPFSVKAIGRVQEASALLEQELVDDMPAPRRSVFSVRYSKALFWVTATRKTITYEYDPLPVIQTPSR